MPKHGVIGMDKKRLSLNDKGFSLLEVLVAVVIFAVGILAMAALQLTAIKGNHFSNNLTEATTIAQEKLEELIQTDYSLSNAGEPLAPGNHSETQGIYTIDWTVQDNTPIQDTKTILITVRWTERGQQHQTTLRLIKSSAIDNSYKPQ